MPKKQKNSLENQMAKLFHLADRYEKGSKNKPNPLAENAYSLLDNAYKPGGTGSEACFKAVDLLKRAEKEAKENGRNTPEFYMNNVQKLEGYLKDWEGMPKKSGYKQASKAIKDLATSFRHNANESRHG